MGRINGGGIAMLFDLDDCSGCYNCEAACQDTHRFGYEEDWLKVVRREPVVVDGQLRQYHLVAPQLDKCALCFEATPTPFCVACCTGGALKVGKFEDMVKEAAGRHCAIFTA